MAAEHVVADAADVPEGTHRVVIVNRLEIGLFNVAGLFYALPNRCIHQGGPVCTGRVSGTLVATAEDDWRPRWVYDGEVVTCPWHGLEFHIPTGRCLAYPRIHLRAYRVKVEDGKLKIVL